MGTKRTKSGENNLIVPGDPRALCIWAYKRDVQPKKKKKGLIHFNTRYKNKIQTIL